MIIGVIILCIIIVSALITHFIDASIESSKLAKYNDTMMYGFYIGDKAFCETADCSSIQIFIGEAVSHSPTVKNAHIVINNSIANSPLTITYTKPTKCTRDIYKIDTTLEFEEHCDIPTQCTFEFNITDRTLKIYDADTVYGVFYKDNEVSKILKK